MTSNPLKVGIIGQGRSGRDIHANLLVQLPGHYRIAAIADALPERRDRARQEFGCETYETWEEMVAREELDLVVNASPSHLHFPISLELLNRGFNVLCEKPLAKSPEEVDELIAASVRSGKLLAVFQQSRYHPAFQQIRSVIDSGVLGRIVQVDISLNGFARRWDWQTLQSNNGGNLMNTGPHPVDQALQLFGTDVLPQITCIMDRANTFGDAEDYVKLIMRGQGRPTVDIEISSCCVYPQDAFNIQGTNGGLRGSGDQLEWKYFKPEEAPAQQLIKEPLINANGLPAYCNETLDWHQNSWKMSLPEGQSLFGHMTERLYLMLHDALTTGAPLEITPEQVRQQMWVMEECRRQNPHIYNGQAAAVSS
ncbi:Gfo/Idh/MocA family protein [Paenibacillus sp. PAMC21692]|uniref:Gfo/Idh/MocA family protein n=1 Tax=Paenibacillus sp. PAMC21692 TaxID=2762320 RepID=UPI00164E9C2C|nr:Gfo/Idh/MocA family oxidoreductase [Paenibacillus sp. PAMC21692]QNK54895.1 Gfo/Idh/MocA family oxidoreductase [Paenibacillus sp. PAMC21692]